jgi:ferredoxin
MRVKVDFDLCQGHGVCQSEAPEVFRVDEKAGAVVVLDERPPESLRSKVAHAATYCPTRAITVEDE